ncbi:hypothetical protein K2P96_02335 [Patescibacteria group bacterium]|nr:hypothetical protein [Patescibacteria group bacterium]
MNTQSKVLKWSLIIGMVIVLNMFFNYTLSLVYKNPDYNTFCPNSAQVVEPITTKQQCLDLGGQWNGNDPMLSIKDKNVPAGYCDAQFTCRNDYDAANKVYNRNVFITLVLLGAVCVALANFVKGNIVIGTALSLGGVLSFVIASMRYWGSADDLIKVIILAIALGILAWVAMKKFKNN